MSFLSKHTTRISLDSMHDAAWWILGVTSENLSVLNAVFKVYWPCDRN